MTEREARERLSDMEQRHSIFSHRIDGIAVWRLFRKEAMILLQGENADAQQDVPPAMACKIGRYLYACLQGAKVLFAGRRPALALSYGHMLVAWQGCFEDIFVDPLLQDFPGDHVKILHYGGPLWLPLALPMQAGGEFVSLLAKMYTAVGKKPQTKETAKSIADFLVLLGMDPEASRRLVASRLAAHAAEKAAYSLLLARLKPELILLPYSQEFALSAAAAERSIPVAEVVHGFITTDDPDFLNEKDKAPGGLMPRNCFLVQGEWWRQYMASGGFYDEKKFAIVGNRYISALRKQRWKAGKGTETCDIVLGMPGIGSEALLDFVADALRTLEGPYVLHVRIHPRHGKSLETYERRLSSLRIRYILYPVGNQTAATPELLVKAVWHVSSSSSCHMDALALGVPTVILPGKESHIMKPLYGLPGVYAPQSCAELCRLLEAPPSPVPDWVTEYFSADYSSERTQRTLSAIAQGSNEYA